MSNPEIKIHKNSKMPEHLHRYFDVIDTEHKAYWLGFLAADGHIRHCKQGWRVSLCICGKDRGHLEKFAAIFGKNISTRESHIKGIDKTYTNCTVVICSKVMVTTLNNMGFDNRKSETLTDKVFNFVPLELTHHLIRGYVDGDGCIYRDGTSFGISIISTQKFLIKIQEIFKESCGANTNQLVPSGGKAYTFKNVGTLQIIKIRDYLYKDATVFLDRKKDIFFEATYNRKKTSKFMGVYYRKDIEKWAAQIGINDKSTNIGTFLTEIEAAKAYDRRILELGYPLFKLNFKQ